jgi:hypothetical protein
MTLLRWYVPKGFWGNSIPARPTSLQKGSIVADLNMQFHKWWEGFKEEHEEWKMADSNALRYSAYEAGRNEAIKESALAFDDVYKALKWMSSHSCKDAQGYEYGICRVKFDNNGQPASVIWSNIDEVIAQMNSHQAKLHEAALNAVNKASASYEPIKQKHHPIDLSKTYGAAAEIGSKMPDCPHPSPEKSDQQIAP